MSFCLVLSEQKFRKNSPPSRHLFLLIRLFEQVYRPVWLTLTRSGDSVVVAVATEFDVHESPSCHPAPPARTHSIGNTCLDVSAA
jgi:hypothetical protein